MAIGLDEICSDLNLLATDVTFFNLSQTTQHGELLGLRAQHAIYTPLFTIVMVARRKETDGIINYHASYVSKSLKFPAFYKNSSFNKLV